MYACEGGRDGIIKNYLKGHPEATTMREMFQTAGSPDESADVFCLAHTVFKTNLN